MRKSAIAATAAERAEQAAWKLRQTELEQRVSELADRLRESELAAKAQARAAGLKEKSAELAAKAQPKVEELSARAQERGSELAARAQERSSELAARAQERSSELAARAQERSSELAARAQERGSELADESMRRVGERLSQGRVGERLGIQPAGAGRRWPWLVAALVGITAGYVIGVLTGARKGDQIQQAVDQGRREASPLVDAIRAQLTSDPRTAGLPDLSVNVAGGVVFIRGTIPADFDEKALREVIERVPGVEDVDVQVMTAGA